MLVNDARRDLVMDDLFAEWACKAADYQIDVVFVSSVLLDDGGCLLGIQVPRLLCAPEAIVYIPIHGILKPPWALRHYEHQAVTEFGNLGLTDDGAVYDDQPASFDRAHIRTSPGPCVPLIVRNNHAQPATKRHDHLSEVCQVMRLRCAAVERSLVSDYSA